MWLGEYEVSGVVDFKFSTRNTAGLPTALVGGVVSIYQTNDTTQTTTGVTLTTSFDSMAGTNHVRIALTGDLTFYATGRDFAAVITSGTVSGTSVSGEVVGQFSIRNRASLYPTTASRTLDVSSGGEAGVDWANVGSPTTTLNLSATTIKTATDVETIATTISGAVIPEVADILTAVNAISGAAISEIADIKAKTDNLPASPAAVGSAMTLTSGERTAIADAHLNRDMDAVSVTNSRSPINAHRAIRNKTSLVGATLSVYEEDDTTVAWTATVTTDAAADPITVVDPA